jgi:L-lactate utilization protein LutB
MDIQIEKILSSLHSRHIQGVFAENAMDARQKIMSLIPEDAIVGIGDSTTMRQLGIPQALKERGIKVIDPFERNGSAKDPKDAFEGFKKLLKEATVSDFFLTGTNAITRDGKLVNLDAVGNRVAGMFWGHPTSIIVVGRNKIVKDMDEALSRIRTLIAPNHVRIRVALGGISSKTPCAVTGECSDCRSIERICNIFSIIEGKPFFTDLHVVIVDEDLGLAWDPSWPQDRVTRIVEGYKKLVWVPIEGE